jgi:two-component system cell cycle response regulator DivK
MTSVRANAPLVLIVDDSDKNRKLARDVLHAGGLRTVEAEDGHGALALAAESLPDVILLDLRLPDMDGRDVARALRDGVRTRLIPVVALSALRYGGDPDALSAEGFAGFLEKPIDVRAFSGQVRSYCHP